MMKDWYFYKSLSQLGKDLTSSGNKKTCSGARNLELSGKRLYQNFAFVLILAFGLSCFGTNFCLINLVVANSISIIILTDSYRICFYKMDTYSPQH